MGGAHRPRTRLNVTEARAALTEDLTAAGIEVEQLSWLPLEESRVLVRQWIDLGAERWGRLSINPPASGRVRRAELADDVSPDWLAAPSAEVIVMFFRPAADYLLARCAAAFAVAERVRLARTDGDGYGAFSPSLDDGLLVNVETSRLGDAALEIDAWGYFVHLES